MTEEEESDEIAVAERVTESDVRARASNYFDGLSPGHDWQHVRRVVATAKRLADDTEQSVDRGVLVAAGWLHDIGRGKESRGEIDDHGEWGAEESRRILGDLGVGAERQDAVAHCVHAHRYSNDVEPATIEAELLCDADNLDATGAVGIARVFANAGEHGEALHDPDLPAEDDDSVDGATAINHFYKKILDLEMYTAAGQRVKAEREAYVESYLERFEREARGADSA